MKLQVEAPIFQLFPDIRLGVLWTRGIHNRGEDPQIRARLRQAEQSLLRSFQGSSAAEHPRIAPWREAYRKFGAKPKKYPSSIENLARRTLKGEHVRHINKLVDIYNAISLRHILPAGGEDLNCIQGDIVLTFAGEDEAPVRLLGDSEEKAPRPGEVIYKDDVGAICRRWNWKEADRTKLTENTRNAVLVIEALPPVTPKELVAAVNELAEWIRRYCGGEVQTAILDEDRRATDG